MKSKREAKLAFRKDYQNEVSRRRRILQEKGDYSYPMNRRHRTLVKVRRMRNEEM
jgi:hypothetical protein